MVLSTGPQAFAEEEPAAEPPKDPPPSIVEVSPGVFQIGKLRLDKNTHSVTFPATLNMTEGSLEYLMVTPQGSTHESLLKSEIKPSDLHFVMLLMGAKGAPPTPAKEKDSVPSQINEDYLKTAPALKGDSILISARWNKAGKEVVTRVEDWVMNEQTRKALSQGPWIYNGSRFWESHFMAQMEGCFATLVTNPSALINNPRQGNDNDHIWVVHKAVVPPRDTALELIIQLVAPKDPSKTHSK
jgi:hypothetical protein